MIRTRRLLAKLVVVLLAGLLMAGQAGPALAASSTPPLPTYEDYLALLDAPDEEWDRHSVEVLAGHDPDPAVRDAAAKALASKDPARYKQFLDVEVGQIRLATDLKARQEQEKKRKQVEEWSKTGTPGVRKAAAEALKGNDPYSVDNFIAWGKKVAEQSEQATVEATANRNKTVRERVQLMLTLGGPEVRKAAQTALDTNDPVTIKVFFEKGYFEAAQRDADVKAELDAALAARAKAVNDLTDLASRSATAADARTAIIKTGGTASTYLAQAASSMRLAHQAAKKAEKIYNADLPSRVPGSKGRTDQLTLLTQDARDWAKHAAGDAEEVHHVALASNAAAKKLTETGLTRGIDWAQVTDAMDAAAQAAAQAADTAWHAAEATEAASKALDANTSAQAHADNAVKWRQEAETQALHAEKLAQAAEAQAKAAQTAASQAKDARGKAEQAERSAWQHARNAHDARGRAEAHQASARGYAGTAIGQRGAAATARARAATATQAAIDAQNRAATAGDKAVEAGKNFEQARQLAYQAGKDAQTAEANLNAAKTRAAARNAGTANSLGSINAAAGKLQAGVADQEVAKALTASQAAGRAAGDTRTAAINAGAAAGAAWAEANAASAEAEKARAQAAAAHQDAVTAQQQADRATAQANQAANDAQASIELANQSTAAASQAFTAAQATQTEADAASADAMTAAIQASIARRAALETQYSAAAIAAPAGAAITGAAPHASTSPDAALALDTALHAVAIGPGHVTAANTVAGHAEQAANDAKAAADRAAEQVKPAYQAASKASQSSLNAARSAQTAVTAAQAAATDAAAARTAGDSAARADKQAAADAAGARNAAAGARDSASLASSAAAAAAGDADTARHLATGASTALISAGLIAIRTHALANHIDPLLKQMREQAGVLHQQLPGLDLRYKQADHQKQLEFAKLVIDQAAKLGLGNITGRITGGVGEQALNGVHGLWEMANCHQPSKFGTAACSDILTGAAQLAIAFAEKDSAKLAEALFHKEEWEKDPLKAAGMVGFDLATLFLPFPKGTAALGKGLTTAGNKTGTTIADLAAATGKTIGDTTKALTDQLASLALSDTNLNALLKNAGAINTARLAAELDAKLPATISAVGADNLGTLVSLAGADQVTNLLNRLAPTTLAKTIADVGVSNVGAYLATHGADNLAATITSRTSAQSSAAIREGLDNALDQQFAVTALADPGRLQHAWRHLEEKQIVGNWKGKSSPGELRAILTPILINPIKKVTPTIWKGETKDVYVGMYNGNYIAAQVFTEGVDAGKLATAFIPTVDQLKGWGVIS